MSEFNIPRSQVWEIIVQLIDYKTELNVSEIFELVAKINRGLDGQDFALVPSDHYRYYRDDYDGRFFYESMIQCVLPDHRITRTLLAIAIVDRLCDLPSTETIDVRADETKNIYTKSFDAGGDVVFRDLADYLNILCNLIIPGTKEASDPRWKEFDLPYTEAIDLRYFLLRNHERVGWVL